MIFTHLRYVLQKLYVIYHKKSFLANSQTWLIIIITLLPSLIARRWVGRQTQWWPRHKLFILVGLGCCLAHRGSTVGFHLLQCSSGVVRHTRDLQVSVATRFCRVLIFASSQYLSVIYLFHVMIHWWVRKPSRGPNNCMFWAMTEAEGEVGYPYNRFKPPSILILTVPRRCFCCGSLLLLVLAVRVYTLIQLLC